MWLSNEDFRACEDTIAPFVLCIAAFVRRRGVSLERYDHGAPVWTLSFRHPKGGTGSVVIAVSPGHDLTVRYNWSISDYDAGTHSLKKATQAALLLPVSAEVLSTALDAALDELLSWSLDQLPLVHRAMQREWHRVTRAEFYAANAKLPMPTT